MSEWGHSVAVGSYQEVRLILSNLPITLLCTTTEATTTTDESIKLVRGIRFVVKKNSRN